MKWWQSWTNYMQTCTRMAALFTKFSPVILIRRQVIRPRPRPENSRPRTFSTAQGQAKAKARHVQGQAKANATAATLLPRNYICRMWGNGTGRPPAYGPPVRAVGLIIFLVAAWRAASSTLTSPWKSEIWVNLIFPKISLPHVSVEKYTPKIRSTALEGSYK